MEFEPLQKGDRVHHDDAGHGVVKTVLGAGCTPSPGTTSPTSSVFTTGGIF
jgi:hypothetical protein